MTATTPQNTKQQARIPTWLDLPQVTRPQNRWLLVPSPPCIFMHLPCLLSISKLVSFHQRMGVFESWLAEKAREELETLETQHPSRFSYLKLELKSLISQPESCSQLFYGAMHEDDNVFSPVSVASTRVSSNRKRKSGRSKDAEEKKVEKSSSAGGRVEGDRICKKSCSSVEAAVRRAEACLVRIQQVKESLFC